MTILMIIGAVLLRLVPHMPNFAPITAIALFSGVYLNKRTAFLLPVFVMIISDYLLLYINPFGSSFIDLTHFYPPTALLHKTTIYVYGSFILSGVIGIWLKKHANPGIILTASFLASIQFFLITNFGVWKEGMYSRGIEGLLESYIMGLPFFKYTLLGDLFYTAVFFGTYKLAVKCEIALLRVAD